jgi:two-component system sensor histidine kinase KdpD
MGAFTCMAVAVLAAPLHNVFESANIVLVFLLAVALVALLYGRGPAAFAAFLSVGLFDFFYVPPIYSLRVQDHRYLLTFAVMLGVALVIGLLTAGLKFEARVAKGREDQARALYNMSRELSGAVTADQVAHIAERFLRSEFDADAALMLPDANERLCSPVRHTGRSFGLEPDVAQRAFDHAQAVQQGRASALASTIVYLPLHATTCVRGVLAVAPRSAALLEDSDQRLLLDTGASLLSIALERIHCVEAVQRATLQVESARLRNALLAGISHDLRTPLAGLVVMAESLMQVEHQPVAHLREISGAIGQAAARMNSLVGNLLGLARLHADHVSLNLQWLPLEEVVGSSLRAMRAALDRHHVCVNVGDAGSGGDDFPMIRADPVLIERLLCNLLENALRQAPAGSAIDISAQALDGAVQLAVSDQGPGLPPGFEEAVFLKWEPGHDESATTGRGVGLAFCRAIAQAHGGSIRGETLPTGGARFTVALPQPEPPPSIDIEDDEPELNAA